jgi:diketogulonate reductase-like aldo/keto reductase
MPADEENYGAADRIIGRWLKGRDRKDVVLATKVAGYSEDIYWLRKSSESGTRVNKAQITESVDASLKRLGTDYIDLLQIEWPDRYTQLFGSSSFSVAVSGMIFCCVLYELHDGSEHQFLFCTSRMLMRWQRHLRSNWML